MRFEIEYVADYEYSEPVRDNLNALRIRPASTLLQEVEAFEVRVEPDTRLRVHRDYFGTEVVEFDITDQHERLKIEARAAVETREPPEPAPGSWEAVASDAYRLEGGEYLLQTELPPASGVEALLEATRRETPLETVLAISEVIPDRFKYDTESTFVGSTVGDLLEGGAGVCQDFVHLGLMLLRCHGIAARYMSGYLFAAPEDGGRDSVEVQTHAWLQAMVALGEGSKGPQWVGIDPTNRGYAGETHVKIGHGRSYQDVPPIRGVYRGAAAAEVDARVRMHRLNGDNGSGPGSA
jgi:transglutaminase-like putative cysteine protease